MENTTKTYTPQESYDTLLSALNFVRPLTHVLEGLKGYLEAEKNKPLLLQEIDKLTKERASLRDRVEREKARIMAEGEAEKRTQEVLLATLKEEIKKDVEKYKEECETQKRALYAALETRKEEVTRAKEGYNNSLLSMENAIATKEQELLNLDKIGEEKKQEQIRWEQQAQSKKEIINTNLAALTATFNDLVTRYEALKKKILNG